MSEEEFLLKWNDHHASFFNIVEDLCRTEQLCDVTLACGGQVFETHKLILSVCSPYFRTLLNRYDKHPIVYLKDVNPKHLEQLLSYMYRGEINVLQNDLGPLIETARGLQIKGLADAGGGGGGGGGEKKPQNGPAPKRARTATPNPPSQAPKVPKIAEQPPKSLEMPSPAAAIAYSPVTVTHPEQSIVKQEEDDSGWTEESIPSESYEQDMQLEDEQYIQSGDTGGGLSGQQMNARLSLPSSLSITRHKVPPPPSLTREPSAAKIRETAAKKIPEKAMSPPSPAVSPPSSFSLQPWCNIKPTKELFQPQMKVHHPTNQIELPLSNLERLSSGLPRKHFNQTKPPNHPQVYQSPLLTRPLKYSMPIPEVQTTLSSSTFTRPRPGRVSELDPIKDTLNQLSRLAGSGSPPNQTTMLPNADSNQPIVHRESPAGQPASQPAETSADKTIKKENIEEGTYS